MARLAEIVDAREYEERPTFERVPSTRTAPRSTGVRERRSTRTRVITVVIDVALVRSLLATQFPQWAGLPIRPVIPGGWDNKTFRVGGDLLVRMPSAEAYATQVEKELRWLDRLAPSLPLRIPVPVALGAPGGRYPWQWGVYQWLDGKTASAESLADSAELAATLARFLVALQRTDASGGPQPGRHNFHRGGPLCAYDGEVRRAINALGARVDCRAVTTLWQAALDTAWEQEPVWVHGDIAPTNLLVRRGRLCAVIDFGLLAVGDPACDLSIYWSVFRARARAAFSAVLTLDAGTWLRARAWALWKALVVAAGIANTNALQAQSALRLVQNTLIAPEGAPTTSAVR